MADALALSRAVDLGEVGITGPAAVAIAGYFGNLDEEENLEPVPLSVPLPEPLTETEPEADELELYEPEPEPPPEPMAEFDVAAVLAWLRTVPGLTVAQRAAAARIMAEDEYEGAELVGATAKTLRRL